MHMRHLLATLGAAATISSARAQSLAKATLRLKWLPQAQFAGFYVAAGKGYYKAEGIDLTINPGGPNLLTENLVASGADSFGLSGRHRQRVRGARQGAADRLHRRRAPDHPLHLRHPHRRAGQDDWPISGQDDHHLVHRRESCAAGMLAKDGIKPGDFNIQPQQVTVTPFVDGNVDVVTATHYNEFYTIQSPHGPRTAEDLRRRGLRHHLPARHADRQPKRPPRRSRRW